MVSEHLSSCLLHNCDTVGPARGKGNQQKNAVTSEGLFVFAGMSVTPESERPPHKIDFRLPEVIPSETRRGGFDLS